MCHSFQYDEWDLRKLFGARNCRKNAIIVFSIPLSRLCMFCSIFIGLVSFQTCNGETVLRQNSSSVAVIFLSVCWILAIASDGYLELTEHSFRMFNSTSRIHNCAPSLISKKSLIYMEVAGTCISNKCIQTVYTIYILYTYEANIHAFASSQKNVVYNCHNRYYYEYHYYYHLQSKLMEYGSTHTSPKIDMK